MITVYPVRKAGASMRGINHIVTNLLSQRGHMYGWVPVCLAAGIGVYFLLRFEPVDPLYLGVGLLGVLGLIATRWMHEILSPHCRLHLSDWHRVFHCSHTDPFP